MLPPVRAWSQKVQGSGRKRLSAAAVDISETNILGGMTTEMSAVRSID
jgi:hypothetical protein